MTKVGIQRLCPEIHPPPKKKEQGTASVRKTYRKKCINTLPILLYQNQKETRFVVFVCFPQFFFRVFWQS